LFQQRKKILLPRLFSSKTQFSPLSPLETRVVEMEARVSKKKASQAGMKARVSKKKTSDAAMEA